MNPLIAHYKQLLKLEEASFSLIEHEDAMVASVYKVTTPKNVYILKICPRREDYLRETYFLKLFKDLIPIPEILQLVDPHPEIPGAILMNCLPGQLLSPKSASDTLGFEIGITLAKIHSTKVPGYGDLTQPDKLCSDPRIPFTDKFEEGLSECKDHLPSALIDQCLTTFNHQLNLLSSVDGPCVVHRDFRPGNIMVFDNQLKGILDWSSGRGGFAEEDFCPLEMGEGLQNSSYQKAFLAGYSSIRPIPHYRELLPLLSLNRALGIIGFTVKRHTWNTLHTRLYRQNRQILENLCKR